MSETPDEPTMVARVLTCHTDGCGNADAPIRLDVPDTVTSFVCGVCGQPIDDVADAAPEGASREAT